MTNVFAAFTQATRDLVRPGISLFGVAPRATGCTELRPTIRVRTEIVSLRELARGKAIGYGLFASTKIRIARNLLA